jgi:hypothetical protein
MRVLAYRLQADAFGGLDKSIQRMLRSDKGRDDAPPFDRRAPQTRGGVGLKAGTGSPVPAKLRRLRLTSFHIKLPR